MNREPDGPDNSGYGQISGEYETRTDRRKESGEKKKYKIV